MASKPPRAKKDQRREEELYADDLVIGRKDVFPEKAHLDVLMSLGSVRQTYAHACSCLAGISNFGRGTGRLIAVLLGLGRLEPIQIICLVFMDV